jgi:hypothetical protein
MQARFYAPWYGRFLSPDPARDQHFEQTQSWNIYSYVQNNPTMHIDPTGMELAASADVDKKLRPQLQKLAVGGTLTYKDGKYSLTANKGEKQGAGFNLLNKIINAKGTVDLHYSNGEGGRTSGVGGAYASITVGTGKSFSEVIGTKGMSLEQLSKSGSAKDVMSAEMPQYLTLGHELIHGLHLLNNSVGNGEKGADYQVFPGRIDRDKREEFRTIGLPGFFRKGEPTENELRKEHGEPARITHSSSAIVEIFG